MPDDRSSPRVTTGSLRLGVLLSLTGGFLDAFTFLQHGGVFATAQTGNLVLIGVRAATGEWSAALRHVPALLAFVAGVATAETILHPRVSPVVRRPRRVALVAELVVLTGVGLMPRDAGSLAIVVLVAYVSAMQNAMFNTLRRWSFNTVIATGNLSTATRAAYRAVVLHEPGAAEQARSFGAICLAFFTGAILGAFATRSLGNAAAWLAAAVVLAALSLFVLDEAWVGRGRA